MVTITDWNDLDAVRNDLSADYTLANDLDSSTAGYTGIGDDFTPIGGPFGDPAFNGTFDGQGFQISDLVVSIDRSDVGLFGVVNESTTNTVIIENLSVSGSVTNTGTSQRTGGLAGFLNNAGTGEIRNCVSHVDVTSSGNYVGGLVGNNKNTLTDSYATGSVDGDQYVGGLVGYNNTGTIQTSYAVGSVTANSFVGGLIGSDLGTTTDSYWDTESSGQSTSGSGTGLTTSEMQGQEASTNMTGFDFTNTWDTVLTEDADTSADGYPILLAVDRQNQLEAQGIYVTPPPSDVDLYLDSSGSANLSWVDNATAENGFNIYRSTSGSPSFPDEFTEIDSVGVDVTSYTDSNTPVDKDLTYAITAYNTAGESNAILSTALTPSITVSLSWTDNSDNEDGFNIYQTVASSPTFPDDYDKIDSVGANVTSYDVSRPPVDPDLNYAVVAYNTVGESGASTTANSVNLTPNTPSASDIGVSRGRRGKVGSSQSSGIAFDSNFSITPDKTRIYRTTSSNPTFPDDYTLVGTVDGEVSDFEDSSSPYGTNVFYAVTVELWGTESSPTKSDTFIPPEDAAGVNPNLNP